MRGQGISVSPATEGQKFRYRGTECEVRAGCGGGLGRWLCLNHPADKAMASYRTQLQKDIHIGTPGPHVLAWICADHGPEVP